MNIQLFTGKNVDARSRIMMINLRKARIKSAENSQRTKSGTSSNSSSSAEEKSNSSNEPKPPTFNISCTDDDIDSSSAKEDSTTEATEMVNNFKNER